MHVQQDNYGEINAEGTVNVRVSPIVSVQAAFRDVRHNAYLIDVTDEKRQRRGRLEVLLKPREVATLLVQSHYSHFGGDGEGSEVCAPNLPSGIGHCLGSTDKRANAALLVLGGSLGTPNDQLHTGEVTEAPPRGVGSAPSCGANARSAGESANSGFDEK